MKNQAINFRLNEYDRMMASLKGKPDDVRAWVIRAYNAKDWDWITSDGCSGPGPTDRVDPLDALASNCGWLTRYYPPCVAHDYECYVAHRMWRQGFWRLSYRTRWEADKMFYRVSRAYGMSRFRAGFRWLMVRIGAKAVSRWLRSRRK